MATQWVVLIRCMSGATMNNELVKSSLNSIPSHFRHVIYEYKTAEQYFDYEKQTQAIENLSLPSLGTWYAIIIDAGMVLLRGSFPNFSFTIAYATEERQDMLFSRIPVFQITKIHRLTGGAGARLKPKMLPIAHKPFYLSGLVFGWCSDLALTWIIPIERAELMKLLNGASCRSSPIVSKFIPLSAHGKRALSKSDGAAPPHEERDSRVKYSYRPGIGYAVAHFVNLYRYEMTDVLIEILREKISKKYKSLYHLEKYYADVAGGVSPAAGHSRFVKESDDSAIFIRTFVDKMFSVDENTFPKLALAIDRLYGRPYSESPNKGGYSVNFVNSKRFLQAVQEMSSYYPLSQRGRLVDVVLSSTIYDDEHVSSIIAHDYIGTIIKSAKRVIAKFDVTPINLTISSGYYWIISTDSVGKKKLMRFAGQGSSLPCEPILMLDFGGLSKIFITPTKMLAYTQGQLYELDTSSTYGVAKTMAIPWEADFAVGSLLITKSYPFKFFNHETMAIGNIIGIPKNRTIIAASCDGHLLVAIDGRSSYQVLQLSGTNISSSSIVFTIGDVLVTANLIGFVKTFSYLLFVNEGGTIHECSFNLPAGAADIGAK